MNCLPAAASPLHEINRGGDVTYHGPGQLVGYPIFDLRSLQNGEAGGARLGPVDFVRMMEEALIRLCGVYGVRAGRIAGLTGVWCGILDQPQLSSEESNRGAGRKVGAIGIHVSRGITSHGFAFNVTTDLRDFRLINPCGITDRPVTSLEKEIPGTVTLPSLESIAHEAARQFGHVFSQQVLAVESLDALRAQAQLTPPQVAQSPARRCIRRCSAKTHRFKYPAKWNACATRATVPFAPEPDRRLSCAIYNPAGTGACRGTVHRGENDSCQPT